MVTLVFQAVRDMLKAKSHTVKAVLYAIFLLFLSPVVIYADDLAISKETTLGEKVAADIEKAWERVHDAVSVAKVETILSKQRSFLVRSLDYQVRIVDSKMINAFSLPGGITYVTTGMLNFVRTDHELAGVIAHELAHADKKHVMQQVARNQKLTLLALAIAIASRGEGAALLTTSVAQTAIMNAYSITFEKEADASAIQIMYKAGYDPTGMLTLQERLLEEQLKRPQHDLGVAQSHPESRERIQAAERYMSEAHIPIYRKVPLALLRTELKMISSDVALCIDDRAIWKGKSADITVHFFNEVKKRLDHSLQFETLPFDIRLRGEAPQRVLIVGSYSIASESEVPRHCDSIELIRDRLQSALEKARTQHPLANYY